MIFAGTNTGGHADVIKTTAPAGRSAVFGHCFAILAALAGLTPMPRLCFCNPPPSDSPSGGDEQTAGLAARGNEA